MLDGDHLQCHGKGIQLGPPLKLSLDRALEYIGSDEYVEATPKSLRLRKKILDENQRKRGRQGIEVVIQRGRFFEGWLSRPRTSKHRTQSVER